MSRTVYRVTAGTFMRDCASEHHADQLARALRLHGPLRGVPVTVEAIRVPDDALTRMTADAWSHAVLNAGPL
jgi:hypothetical protein